MRSCQPLISGNLKKPQKSSEAPASARTQDPSNDPLDGFSEDPMTGNYDPSSSRTSSKVRVRT